MKILVISSKTVYAAKRLVGEARIVKLELEVMDMQDLKACGFVVNTENFDVLYIRNPYLNGSPKYIPEIIKLAKRFKKAGKRVVDAVIVEGKIGRGKWADYQEIQKAGLPLPFTRNYKLGITNYDYPLILKWNFGFKAQNVFLVCDENQLKKIISLHPKKEWLVQEFVKADYEYKVITVGYQALPVVLRFKILDSGFRTDFEKTEALFLDFQPVRRSFGEVGGSKKHPASGLGFYAGSRLSDVLGRDGADKLISIAEQSSRFLNRELAKVDILESKGRFYILEVNRFPGLKSFEKLTKFNAVKQFLAYLSSTTRKF